MGRTHQRIFATQAAGMSAPIEPYPHSGRPVRAASIHNASARCNLSFQFNHPGLGRGITPGRGWWPVLVEIVKSARPFAEKYLPPSARHAIVLESFVALSTTRHASKLIPRRAERPPECDDRLMHLSLAHDLTRELPVRVGPSSVMIVRSRSVGRRITNAWRCPLIDHSAIILVITVNCAMVVIRTHG
jgi:hypothetical protein